MNKRTKDLAVEAGIGLAFCLVVLAVASCSEKATASDDPIQRIGDGGIEVYRDTTTGCEYLYRKSVTPRMETAPGGGTRHRGCR